MLSTRALDTAFVPLIFTLGAALDANHGLATWTILGIIGVILLTRFALGVPKRFPSPLTHKEVFHEPTE